MNQKAAFHDDCIKEHGGFIIAGSNYGQGSSREHAALAPMYLGIKAVIAKSFARIHQANLYNFGILPCLFKNEADYDMIDEMDELEFKNLHAIQGDTTLVVMNKTKDRSFMVYLPCTAQQAEFLLKGGLLNTLKD